MSKIIGIIPNTFPTSNDVALSNRSIIANVITRILPQFFPLNKAPAIINSNIAAITIIVDTSPATTPNPLRKDEFEKLEDKAPKITAVIKRIIPKIMYRIPKTVTPVGL